jgi:hypothetical protein
VWNLTVTQGYLFHVTQCEQWVESVAANGVDPHSWAYQTQPWLREFGQQWCQGLVDYRNKLEKLFASVIPNNNYGSGGCARLVSGSRRRVSTVHSLDVKSCLQIVPSPVRPEEGDRCWDVVPESTVY